METSSEPANSTVWTLEDTYAGQTFFNEWDFYTGTDPTHGTVNFLNSSASAAANLTYVTANNKVVMRGDNTTYLASGENRDSVRIISQKTYNGGLFILDLDMAPWGCAVWPAFWTLGNGTWPYTGEIDILEGVHDNTHNQITWHTAPGCLLSNATNFTGTPVGQYDCNGLIDNNAGCGIIDWSRASYGPEFDAQGGGVYAMQWDETGIAVWNFYRVAVPPDIVAGTPTPETWDTPSASLAPDACNPFQYFQNHQIVFDITFCGDWAGNSYNSSGCPGTCAQRIMDPANFVNASWIINSLKVYRKQALGRLTNSVYERTSSLAHIRTWLAMSSLTILASFLVGLL